MAEKNAVMTEKNKVGSGTPTKSRSVILGFDPSIQVTGWGVIQSGRKPELLDFGIIKTKNQNTMEIRLDTIFTRALELIDQFAPSVIAVEDPFMGKNASSALTLGQARGVLLLAGARKNLEVAHYPPRVIKSSVVGRGSATKEQVQFMVQRLLGLREPPKPLDASDALAVALCHINRSRLKMLGKR